MPLLDLVQARIDAAAAQAPRIAQQIPPLSDAVVVPIDVVQMIFAALFALLHRLGPQMVDAICPLCGVVFVAYHVFVSSRLASMLLCVVRRVPCLSKVFWLRVRPEGLWCSKGVPQGRSGFWSAGLGQGLSRLLQSC